MIEGIGWPPKRKTLASLPPFTTQEGNTRGYHAKKTKYRLCKKANKKVRR